VGDKLLGDGGSSRQGIVAQEPNNPGHAVHPGSEVSLLPVHEGKVVAPDYFCRFWLFKAEVEATLADRFADGFWAGGVAGFGLKIEPL